MMGFVMRSGAAAAVAAVTGATIMAAPLARPVPVASGFGSSSLVNLTASSSALYLSPAVLAPEANSWASVSEDPTAVADHIDAQFIEFRNAARTDFHIFANKLGYVGKQLYIGVNFGETIVASAIFNGTDMLRGEGVLKNLGEMAADIPRAALWIVADNLYLALPGLPPIIILPQRGPVDSPPEWRRPLPPQLGRPLVVPFPDGPTAADSVRPQAADARTADAQMSALTDINSSPERDSGTARESGVAAGADDQEDRQLDPTEDSGAAEAETELSENVGQPAGRTAQVAKSVDAGATEGSPRATRPDRVGSRGAPGSDRAPSQS